MPDDPIMNDTQGAENEPPPEPADWWVWGVRKIAAVAADLLLAARTMMILVAFLKGMMWCSLATPTSSGNWRRRGGVLRALRRRSCVSRGAQR